MVGTSWCLIDTETTGLRAPIFVVEIAAQRMKGWEPSGAPFRRLINHGLTIPGEASRVHGYTQEILERDGDDPLTVYRELASYAHDLPLASYNLRYDWDDVLVPEWHRLGLAHVGKRGLCLLELARRLLDPVPAGNCKLQTLRQYYRLPARGAHTALGDVETVVDLMQQVLRPLCEARALTGYSEIEAFCNTLWYPVRIPFGKYKGRLFTEARSDADLRDWFKWLKQSDNPRSQAMGAWYLAQLDQPEGEGPGNVMVPGEAALVLYDNPDLARLRLLVDQAHFRLADLESEYTALRQGVNATQAQLFQRLEEQYRELDLLRLRLEMRREFLDTLMMEGEEEAEKVEWQRVNAEENVKREYERAARKAQRQEPLTDEQTRELRHLWRKLVKLFHPDRLGDDPQRQGMYGHLTAEINRARDEGNIDLLKAIGSDPEGFIARRGWGTLHSREIDDLLSLQRLHQDLQEKILDLIGMLDDLKSTPEHELFALLRESPDRLDAIVAEYRTSLTQEITELMRELQAIEAELKRFGVAD
jgi:DNA polymerase III epsilon subunit-like protein